MLTAYGLFTFLLFEMLAVNGVLFTCLLFLGSRILLVWFLASDSNSWSCGILTGFSFRCVHGNGAFVIQSGGLGV